MNFFLRLWYFRYLRFKKKLLKNQKWHKTFDHFYFEYGAHLGLLKKLAKQLNRDKNLLIHLPKPVHEYDNPRRLEEDLYEYVDMYRYAKAALDDEDFPRHFKKILRNNMKEYIAAYRRDSNFFDRGFTDLTKYVDMMKVLNKKNIPCKDERDKLMLEKINQVSKTSAKVLVKDFVKKLLIIEIDIESAKLLAPKKWCIVQSEDSWMEYVGNKKQILVYDFSLLDTFEDHLIGFTYSLKKKEIKYAFDQDNNKIKTGKMYKYIHEIYAKVHN